LIKLKQLFKLAGKGIGWFVESGNAFLAAFLLFFLSRELELAAISAIFGIYAFIEYQCHKIKMLILDFWKNDLELKKSAMEKDFERETRQYNLFLEVINRVQGVKDDREQHSGKRTH